MKDGKPKLWERLLWPLLSRKAQVAIASGLAGYFTAAGLVEDEHAVMAVILKILAFGVSALGLIWGIAYEDRGRHRGL